MFTYSCIVVGHHDMTHSFDSLVGHSCSTLLRNTFGSHSYFTLLWDMSCWFLLLYNVIDFLFVRVPWDALSFPMVLMRCSSSASLCVAFAIFVTLKAMLNMVFAACVTVSLFSIVFGVC